MHDVAVGNNIVLAFQSQFASITRASLTVACDEIVIADGFGSNKPAFEIGMDNACGLWRLGPFVYQSGPRFLRSDGK